MKMIPWQYMKASFYFLFFYFALLCNVSSYLACAEKISVNKPTNNNYSPFIVESSRPDYDSYSENVEPHHKHNSGHRRDVLSEKTKNQPISSVVSSITF